MKILIAPDSFKESISAAKAAEAIARGIRDVLPAAETVLLPIADGGEGTVEALVKAAGGRLVSTAVSGPLGDEVCAPWGILPDGTGVIEMAAASGLPLVPLPRRNPLLTSTLGTGQLIRAALDQGCTRIILGVGGSATNDGGAGALAVLGAALLDERGREISPNAQGLLDLHTIDTNNIDPRLAKTRIEVASDVDNPLLGPRGAAAIFGPQKGADPAMVSVLEQALTRLAEVVRNSVGKDIASFPGSGAAGGLAAGLSIISPVVVRPGIELVLDTINFASHLQGADLVFTGEGKIDGQSVMGKALSGIARLAGQANVPVIALCGALGPGYQEVYSAGVTA
ncbi:MAG TPA: glycerate kinase, partial [Firmicutes bacterium]|nr:glycerate kinase [Bacillota bacterium]